MCKCKWPNDIVIKPDGVNELDPCIYQTVEAYANVIVEIQRCKKCGHTEVVWHRTEDTVPIDLEEIGL